MTQFAGRYGPEDMEYPDGTHARNRSVIVYEDDGVTLADLYTSRFKIAPVANPVMTDYLGNLTFFANPAHYTCDIDGYRFSVQVNADPEEPFSGSAPPTESVIVTASAYQNISGHQVVTRRSDGSFDYASNDDISNIGQPLLITTEAAVSDTPLSAVAYGLIQEPTWSWTPGPLYLGQGGSIVQTPPTAIGGALFLAQIGSATGATRVFVERFPSIKLI